MRRSNIWEQAYSDGGLSEYEDARSVLNTRSNSGASFWSENKNMKNAGLRRETAPHHHSDSFLNTLSLAGTDEEGFHTPTSTLSRASSIRSTCSRPTSALMQRRNPAYQSSQSRAWVRYCPYKQPKAAKSLHGTPKGLRVATGNTLRAHKHEQEQLSSSIAALNLLHPAERAVASLNGLGGAVARHS